MVGPTQQKDMLVKFEIFSNLRGENAKSLWITLPAVYIYTQNFGTRLFVATPNQACQVFPKKISASPIFQRLPHPPGAGFRSHAFEHLVSEVIGSDGMLRFKHPQKKNLSFPIELRSQGPKTHTFLLAFWKVTVRGMQIIRTNVVAE